MHVLLCAAELPRDMPAKEWARFVASSTGSDARRRYFIALSLFLPLAPAYLRSKKSTTTSFCVVCAESGRVGVWVGVSGSPIDAGAQGRGRRRRQTRGREGGSGFLALCVRAPAAPWGVERKSKGSPQKLICSMGCVKSDTKLFFGSIWSFIFI